MLSKPKNILNTFLEALNLSRFNCRTLSNTLTMFHKIFILKLLFPLPIGHIQRVLTQKSFCKYFEKHFDMLFFTKFVV